jgi:hypothetical protein
MRLLRPLSVEFKLELIAKISESLKSDINNEKPDNEILLEKLSGSWSDVDDSIVDEILESRTSSNRNISFD